jgi:hypothetical protein
LVFLLFLPAITCNSHYCGLSVAPRAVCKKRGLTLGPCSLAAQNSVIKVLVATLKQGVANRPSNKNSNTTKQHRTQVPPHSKALHARQLRFIYGADRKSSIIFATLRSGIEAALHNTFLSPLELALRRQHHNRQDGFGRSEYEKELASPAISQSRSDTES